MTNQSRTTIFNGDNKQIQVKDANGSPIGTYCFDGEGKRVKKVTDLETTVYVYSSGKLVAEYSTAAPPAAPTTSYTATDMLGSPRVLTNSMGEVVSRRDFMPFGEELFADDQNRTTAGKYSQTGQDSVRKRFTGYEKDPETGLDFAEARMYNNQHGRFTAVDPLLASGKSANPQTFNRYVYVLNNPLILTDPTGLQVGDWFIPVLENGDPDPTRSYSYITRGDSTAGYRLITERNSRGELIGSLAGRGANYVLRFNPDGPFTGPIYNPGLANINSEIPAYLNAIQMSSFQLRGYDEIHSDAYNAWCTRYCGLEDSSADIIFAIEGGSLLKTAGKSLFESALARGATESGDLLLLRTMKVGDDGLPVTGNSMTTLGPRPNDVLDGIGPGKGGMSVTPEGGTLPSVKGKNLQTFCIKCRDLGPNLQFRFDPRNPINHGFVESIGETTFEEYQQNIWNTLQNWKLYKK